MTYMRAWMSLIFGKIRLLVSKATDRFIIDKRCCHFFSAVFYPILFILAGNEDMHESSEKYKITKTNPFGENMLFPLLLEEKTVPHGEKSNLG